MHLAQALTALKLGSEHLERQPKDWLVEAAYALGHGRRRIPAELLPVRTAIDAARDHYEEQVRITSAWILIAATRKAQQLKRGVANSLRYGAVSPGAIRLAIPADQLWLIGIGPKRCWRAALAEAAQRHPNELWRDRKGWRSLGRKPGEKPTRTEDFSGKRLRSGFARG